MFLTTKVLGFTKHIQGANFLSDFTEVQTGSRGRLSAMKRKTVSPKRGSAILFSLMILLSFSKKKKLIRTLS